MFDISLSWQSGAAQCLIYAAIITGVLFLLSKIEMKGKDNE